jgi:predicted DNA-binding transcriptional regulator AlpA
VNTDLAGLAELADILGVSKRTAVRYTRRAGFPKPIATLAATPVWRGEDLTRWKDANLPFPQDPRPRTPK